MNKKILIVAGIVALTALFFAAVRLISLKKPGGIVSAEAAAARGLEERGDISGARSEYLRLIGEIPNSREVLAWQKKVEDLNIKLLFSSSITAGTSEYEIKPGDSLEKIARDFKTTVDLIKKSNGILSDNIFPGKKIKVRTAPFSIVVDKSQNLLLLKDGDEVFKSYTVATGSNNSTPVGTFKVIEKIVNPPWYKPGKVVPAGSPENILGTRWLGLTKEGYGIHGTTDPKSLGNQVTAGCVRMANAEVEELFSIVPVGVEVTIVD
ncbi:MAG: L,D-transpeptidase family protein [Candidatus Omnitrophica bacterium]|nr:L,D-transpeptidase family protein [Candidatus Omnitrophota bacterium]